MYILTIPWIGKGSSSIAVDDEMHRESFIVPLQPMFFESDNFYRAVATAAVVKPRNDVYGSIVPQHLLASSLIAEQIRRASGRSVGVVVIIGPNHFNIGTDIIASAQARWQTPLGDVQTDTSLTNKFISDLDLLDDPGVFIKEHSIGVVVPFIKYYLPKSQILPIIFNSYATIEDAERVANWLVDNLPHDSLVIYSIDFSHYLVREAADANDVETRQLIEQGEVQKIMKLGNDHVDSPASLATALLFGQKKGLALDIVAVKNSDDFSNERTIETTSYFIATFIK